MSAWPGALLSAHPHLRAAGQLAGTERCSPSIRELKQPVPVRRWLCCSDPASSTHGECIVSEKPSVAHALLDSSIQQEQSEKLGGHACDTSPTLNSCSLQSHGLQRRMARPLPKENTHTPTLMRYRVNLPPEHIMLNTWKLVESIKPPISQKPQKQTTKRSGPG